MRRLAIVCWLGLLPGWAWADAWEDPDLAQALVEADAVVRVRAPGASDGQPRVRFEVEEALKGALEAGAAIEVGGLHDPTRVAGPTFAAGDRLYLLLRRDAEGRWTAPTPTFGRYPLREGVVKYATLRDTYLRVDLAEADWVQFLRLQLGQLDAAWLDGLRADLARGAPTDEGPARARHYLALEALALVGEAGDAEAIAPFQLHSGPFQLRISACRALRQALGVRAATNLIAAAAKDPEPAVRTVAIQLLAGLSPPPPGLVQQLVKIYPEASADPVRFVGINDPRKNTWPSPRLALIRALRQLGPAPAKDCLLDTLEQAGPDEAEALVLTLGELGDDPALPGQLVDRFLPPGPQGDPINQLICAVLRRVTGQELANEPEAWLNWIAERED